MNPTILGVIGPGFLNQVPTLQGLEDFEDPEAETGLTSTPQVPLNRALMVLNSGYLGYNRG